MAVDRDSELDSATQAYLDNADWRTTSSSAKAYAFIAACTKLMVLLPQSGTSAGRWNLIFKIDEIRKEREMAEKFTDASSTGKVVGLSFENSR